MSLKNVLETARKLGIPVVVTDEAGEAAQVVMPFDDFAAMVGATTPVSRKPRVSRSAGKDEEEMTTIFADVDRMDRESGKIPGMDDLPGMSVGASDDLLLEEKFYLEPLNDEESLK